MYLYLIRHGESESNANGTHSGWSPVNLTEKGRAQAAEARKHVQGLTFDRLFVSDVLRAQQTADIIFPGMPRTFITIAREMNNTTMRGKTRDEMIALYGDKYLECRKVFDYAPLGIDCESKKHLTNRAQEMLNMMTALPDVNRVALVAHAGFIGAAAACVLGVPDTPNLACPNASVSVLRFSPKGWEIVTWGLPPQLP